MLGGPATRPETPLAVENSVGKLAAAEMWRQMPAREREFGELPSPIWSLLDRKVGQGLDVFGSYSVSYGQPANRSFISCASLPSGSVFCARERSTSMICCELASNT